MNIHIHLEYWSADSPVIKRASFGVDELEFKINPNKAALKVAYKWFDNIQKESNYNIKIKSVIYNGENDITEGLKNVLNRETRIAAQEWKAPWE